MLFYCILRVLYLLCYFQFLFFEIIQETNFPNHRHAIDPQKFDKIEQTIWSLKSCKFLERVSGHAISKA